MEKTISLEDICYMKALNLPNDWKPRENQGDCRTCKYDLENNKKCKYYSPMYVKSRQVYNK